MARIRSKSLIVAGVFVHGHRLGHYPDVNTGHARVHRPVVPAVDVDLNDPEIAEMVREFRKS